MYEQLICLIGIYTILAMSLNAICGMTGLLHIGHAGFYAAGAYTAGLIAIYGTIPELGAWNLVIGASAAILVAVVLALAIGAPCLRLRGDYLAIATLGFGEIVNKTLTAVEFPAPLTIAQQTEKAAALAEGVAWNAPPAIGSATGISFPFITTTHRYLGPDYVGYNAAYSKWWLVWLIALVTYVILRNIKFSQTGRAFMCIREDEIAARAMGINVPRYKLTSFALSAAFAGLAGALYFHLVKNINPSDFTFMLSIQVLLMVVLGGMGSFLGSFVAAIVLTMLPPALSYLPNIVDVLTFRRLSPESLSKLRVFAEHKEILFALLLIILIRIVPNGLMGMREWPQWFKRKTAQGGAANA